MTAETAQLLETGAWIGRSQALGLVANFCSAGQAEYLKTVREAESYKSLGLSWDDFCQQHAGITRQYADTVLRNLEEFGATYFRLSQIVRVSAATYRQIAPKIEGETIEIDGEPVSIVPENAPRILEAVHQIRRDLQKSRKQKEDVEKKLAAVGVEALEDLEKRIDFSLSTFIEYFSSCRRRLERRVAERVLWRMQIYTERIAAHLNDLAILE